MDRQRRIPVTALPTYDARDPRGPRGIRRLLLGHLPRRGSTLTGSPVVVDSSKHVSLAFALSHDADLDLRVLHMVRDPRAVAYSWSKEVARPEAEAADERLGAHAAVLVAHEQPAGG